ncbi:glycoside hydrolase [Micromonospora sp. RHAY321]|uniref:glycoside hydrolase n=1 Tax=Micromonospora sp. RHAY321 TaxID=2944807 RepID=UPI00207C759E|nr:glycoside hydrolase [Micromonospora sp. RHAY321]MCO1598594.1 glycoside hydrolase [Micromonospora sp. RHAY321]
MSRYGAPRHVRRGGGRRKALLLGVAATTVVGGLVATMVPLLAADDVSIAASADTTATTVSQDGDNGAKTTLATCPNRCDARPSGAREAVLEFATPTLPPNAVNVRATLRVHAWQAFDATVTVHASTLDARLARPAPGPVGPAVDTVTGVRPGFNEWDVSKLVTGDGTLTVSMAQTGLETRIYWASTENRNPDLRPRLVLAYDVASRPTPTLAPSSAAPSPSRTVAPTTPPPSASASPTRPAPSPPPTSAPRPPTGCGQVSPKLVPSCGAWWGMYSPTNPSTWDHGRAITDIEAQVGRSFDIVHRYHDFSNSGSNGAFPDSYEQQQMREGRVMFFAWESRVFSSGAVLTWKDVYGGRHDGTIDAVAARIRATGVPVFMGFDHEPEDDPGKGSDADFVRAWQYVHDRFTAAGAHNAVWVWTMMGWSGHYGRYAGLYPGDRFVDWVAWDPYNFHVCNGSTTWKSPSTTIGSFYRWLDQSGIGAGKPRMLAEFGTNFDTADPDAKRRWFEEFPAALKAHPKIKAAIYFNSAGVTTRTRTCDMTMNHDASALAGFARAGRDAYLSQPIPGG